MQTLSVDSLVGHRLGNYRVERLLGKGRLNAIFLARNLSAQRMDALTLYLVPEHFSTDAHNRFLARFRKEAAAVTSLVHPHILPIFEYGEQSGYPYLVAPYMADGSLADILKQQGRCEYTYVQQILEQLVAGLAYAHGHGFIHGTLKPSNIVLKGDDSLLVAGFGLMHMLQILGIEQVDQPYAHLLSIAGTFLAAPEYIAPEIVQGQSIDARSDIYALGCILFELLSGRPPFTGSNPLEIAQQHVTQSIPSLRSLCPGVPNVLVSVINQALERDPERRFQHVNELGEAFMHACRGATGQLSQKLESVSAPAKYENRAQETPRSGYVASNWQLMPPIVTSKFAALPTAQSSQKSAAPKPASSKLRNTAPPTLVNNIEDLPIPRTLVDTDEWSTPPRRTNEHMPVPPKAAPAFPPATTPAFPASRQIQGGQQTNRSVPANAAPAQSFKSIIGLEPSEASDLVKAYGWWSQPGEDQAAPQQPALARPQPVQPQMLQQVQPAYVQPQYAPVQEPLRLPPPPQADWTLEPLRPEFGGTMGSQPFSPPKRKMKRRQVLALLATGSVAVAGTALALNYKHLGLNLNQGSLAQNAKPQTINTVKPPMGTTNTGTTQKAPNTGTAPKTAANGAPPPAATNQVAGTVIGASTQAKNSFVMFTNPADQKPALLIHLADGTFKAYDRACTHEGILVNYDPATSTLICPAHGAIFDPANNASVLQGPATRPLTQVNIHVNNDGKITAL